MPDLKDDFYLACNKDALVGITIPDGYRSMGTQMETAIQVDEDIKNLFTSSEKAESHDGQLAWISILFSLTGTAATKSARHL